MEKKNFTKIDAEAINILEKDGTRRLAIFNGDNLPPLIMDGEDVLPGHREGHGLAGIMFYNNEGDECGGLIFASNKEEDGSYTSGLSITFDQYKQDQLVQMLVNEVDDKKSYGFYLYDWPDWHMKEVLESLKELPEIRKMPAGSEKEQAFKELAVGNHRRLAMAREADWTYHTSLYDRHGQPRLIMAIDSNDEAFIEFLDGEGKVTYRLPPQD